MLSLLESAPALSDGPDLTRYALVCGGLVVGILVLGVALRRVLGGTLKARAKTRSLEVLDVLPLSAKQRLCVVRCYDRSFLVGVGEKELLTVAELDVEEVLSPSPDPVVAAQARRVPPVVVAPDEAPAVTPLGAPQRVAQPVAASPRRRPFRDLLAREGVEREPGKLHDGGILA